MEKYIVKLDKEERKYLSSLTKTGKHAASKILHARILLACDEGDHTDTESTKSIKAIAKELDICDKTITRLRKRFVEEGLEVALLRKKHPRRRACKITGDEEAQLITICCSSPPEGRCRWTLKLLSDRLVALEIVESVSPATIGRALKKMNLSRGRNENGVSQKPMPNTFVKWKTF